MPASRMPSALALLRTNQLATATLMGRPPPKLDAVAMIMNTAYSIQREVIMLRRRKAMPIVMMPK